MLESMRLQEVSQIILSVPEGVELYKKYSPKGEKLFYGTGEPVMIINEPSLSNLSFLTKMTDIKDAQGYIGTTGVTTNLDFVINDGAVLYALWSYLFGYAEEDVEIVKLHGTENIQLDEEGYLPLSKRPEKLYLYKVGNNKNELIPSSEYEVCEFEAYPNVYKIEYPLATEEDMFMVTYDYYEVPSVVSHIKQIHNAIICNMDIYMTAVDLKDDSKHIVYIHCDRVQVDTDMVLSVNNSQTASFTPIRIQSIPGGPDLNKDVATVVVI